MNIASSLFSFRKAVLASFLVFVATGLLTWVFADIPFGPIFNTFFHLALISLVFTLALAGIRCLAGKGWWRKVAGGLLALPGLAIALILIVLHVDYTLLPVFAINRGIDKQAWHEDLAHLSAELPKMHPDLFSLVTEARFDEEVAKLQRRIEDLDEVAIRAEMDRLVALPNDGHTYPNIFSLNLDLHIYPLATHFFGDEFTIVDAGREHKTIIGSRITRIDDMPLTTILEKMQVFLPFESESMRWERLNNALGVAEWLYAAGVASRPDRAAFTLVDREGRQSVVTLKAVHYLPCMVWAVGSKVDDEITSIAIKGERRSNYRFELLPDSATLYFQFNLVSEEGQEETLADFTARLSDFVVKHDFDRFVIDVRNNDGGNGGLLPPLVEFLAGSERINREGRLFILTSRRTYSASVMFTSMMQNNTTALTVGEPTSQGPLFYSVPRILKLPNSGREYLVSSELTTAGLSCDRRKSITPDLPVDFTWEDHVEGRDRCLEAAIAYQPLIPTRTPPDQAVKTRIAGRYQYSPLQVLTIRDAGEGLSLEVSDFLPGSTRNVHTRLHQDSPTSLFTDLSGVEIRIAPGTEPVTVLTMVWRGEVVEMSRLPEGRRLPFELWQQGRIEECVRGLLEEREMYLQHVPSLEDMVNRWGYQYLREDRFQEALALFRCNVDLFPDSSNTYDSLGEACLAAGDIASAIVNYRRSLELNPGNENARRVLAGLDEQR